MFAVRRFAAIRLADASSYSANKSRKAIKILVYDGQGFWLCQKRLSKGRFPWWPYSVSAATKALEAHQLAVLLSGGDPEAAKGVQPWRRVDVGQ